MLTLIIALIMLVLVIVWFVIPFSLIKSEFKSDVEYLKATDTLASDRLFNQSDFEKLPMPIQKYMEGCGYIGTPQMSYMCIEYNDVDFMQGKTGPSLTIDYTQYNFVAKPAREALIESSMFGIPFEGYDYYSDGVGGMKGVIAKVITLLEQQYLMLVKQQVGYLHLMRITNIYHLQQMTELYQIPTERWNIYLGQQHAVIIGYQTTE